MANYTEMDGWPLEQIGENGQFYAERKLKCAWADRYLVLQEIGGYGGQLYPYDTYTGAVANGASIAPLGAMNFAATSSPIAAYDHAVIKVKYSTSTLTKISSNWLTEELTPNMSVQNVDWVTPNGKWLPSNNPVTVADNITMLVTSFDYVITYYHTTNLPAAAFTHINKVNEFAVASWLLGMTFQAETLLHTRPTVKRTYDPGLRNTYQLGYRFPFNPNTWNKHFYVDGYYATDKDPLYGKFSFTSLIPSIAP